jgi:hypothetical protein
VDVSLFGSSPTPGTSRKPVIRGTEATDGHDSQHPPHPPLLLLLLSHPSDLIIIMTIIVISDSDQSANFPETRLTLSRIFQKGNVLSDGENDHNTKS